MIQFDSIKLTNFMSFRECELKFNKHGLNLIYGKIGVGKSSIADALVWCLFGKTRKGVMLDGIVNRYVGKNCSVSLTFYQDNNKYVITRYRKHEKYDKAIKLSVNDGIAITVDQSEIDNLIGITYPLFIIANVISSGSESSNILELKSARNEIFQEIFLFAGLEKFEKKISPSIKKLKEEIAQINSKLSAHKARLSTLKSSVTEFTESKQNKLDSLNDELERLNKELDVIDSYDIEELKFKQDEKEKVEKQLDKLEKQSDNADALIRKYNDTIQSITKALNDERIELKNIKDDECPTCGQIMNQDKAENLRKKLTRSISDKEKSIKTYSEELKLYEKTKKKTQKEIKGYQNLTEIYKDLPDVDELQEERERIQNKIETTERFIDDINYNEYVVSQQDKASNIETEIPDLEAQEKEKKEELKYWEWWKEASDIKKEGNYKTWKIKGVMKDFNRMLEDFTSMLFKDDEISDVKIVFQDDLTEKIKVNKVEQPYPLFSTGQRRKLNNCTNFSFFKMVRRFIKPIPFIFVDEAMDGLDNSSQYAILDYLQSIGTDTAIYIISHNDAIKNSVDKAYEVTMENGISNIKEVL